MLTILLTQIVIIIILGILAIKQPKEKKMNIHIFMSMNTKVKQRAKRY
nr:MAG TPA: hypothetical protein [Caudoviricetes sp.]